MPGKNTTKETKRKKIAKSLLWKTLEHHSAIEKRHYAK